MDFQGASLSEIEDEVRFKSARPGDHICTSFQCPNCHSQNIRGQELGDSIQDEAFRCMVIRATLDAFWSHSSKTVAGHVTEVRFMTRYGRALGFNPCPPLGPFPLGHHMGMLQAIMLVMRSTEKGRKKATVQYGTARQIRATSTVVWDASPMSGADITLSSSSVRGKFVATVCPSESRWYHQFNMGISARMGDIVKQDRAYSLELLLKLLELYEAEWVQFGYDVPINSICSVMFLLLTCLGGMRGFEAVWTDLGALRYDVSYCEDREDESGVAWPIVGRFKGERGQAGCHMIPIAGTTKSGIKFFRWTQRFIGRLAMEDITEGWAFRKPDGVTRAVAADYKPNIFGKLRDIQASTSLIDPLCDIDEDYGIQRSGRRFFTSQCIIRGISETDINLQCRWQADRSKGERTIQRSMLHTYAEVRNMKEVLIRPSRSF